MPHPRPGLRGWLSVAVLAAVLRATAARGQAYSIGWSSLDGGGTTTAAGGAYRLGGTIGQPDAGLLGGGSYTIAGGFWSRRATPTSGVAADTALGPPEVRFAGPNPVAGATAFAFRLPHAGRASLELFDLAGQRVRTFVAGAHAAGRYVVHWSGDDASGRRLAAGVYFIRLDAAGARSTRRVVLLR